MGKGRGRVVWWGGEGSVGAYHFLNLISLLRLCLCVPVCACMKYVHAEAFNLWWKSASRLRPIKQIRSRVLTSHSHIFGNRAKELWGEEARWKISTPLLYSVTWQATRLKRKGEKLVISACSLWTCPNETQATQSKRFQRAHWRLLRILMHCGIQFLWGPQGHYQRVNY